MSGDEDCVFKNEVFDYRFDDNYQNTISTELKPLHEFVKWGIDCSFDSKQFKVSAQCMP